jgi:FkbM family methyltransferase
LNKHSFKGLVDRCTGYWIYKSRYLPIGADLKIYITRKAGYSKVETIFDVGANCGQTYSIFRREFPAASIYSFEPVAGPFRELSSRTRGDPKARAENIAFGERVGEKTIRLFDQATEWNSLRDDLMNAADDAAVEKVRVDTIDNYCQNNSITRIDLLKVDTEGYEIRVLEGAICSLQAAKITFLLCEVGFARANTRNTNFCDLAEFLFQLRYPFFGLYDVYGGRESAFANALFVHESVFMPVLRAGS